jgi:Arc/MetJ family transcription regulator
MIASGRTAGIYGGKSTEFQASSVVSRGRCGGMFVVAKRVTVTPLRHLKRITRCIIVCIERCIMRTNVVLNDELVDEAFTYAKTISTKKELIEVALREYVNTRKRKNIRELRGKILFSENYDYKDMRK